MNNTTIGKIIFIKIYASNIYQNKIFVRRTTSYLSKK